MKRLACFFAVLFIAGTVFAQGNPIMEIAYMKVPPNGAEEYISMEREIWKPVHQERINNGKLLGWYLLRVEYPGGSNADYNFVAVNIYPSIADLDDPYAGIEWKAIHPAVDAGQLMERTDASRNMVHTEVFELIDEAIPGQPDVMPRYIAVNKMLTPVGGNVDYEAMERRIWKPLHQERIRQQRMEDWMLLRRILPNGTRWNYNYITWDAYASYLDFNLPFQEETFDRIHPNKRMDKTMENTIEQRTHFAQEMWSVIDYLYRSPQGTTSN